MKQDRIILGIDPGVATVGFAVLRVGCDELELRDFGVITTSPDMEFPERLGLLQSDLRHLIGRHAPTEAYVEELFFGVNSKTALSVAHARGVILAELFSSGIQARSVTPNQVKLGVTGDGSADKRQLQDFLKRQFHLRDIPRPDDAADAIAIAYYGSLQLFP